jgi:DNA-binding transcriptional LysR family regulator
LIDLRQLRHLVAVAEHRNFSRAAVSLHLTQPALSRSIQALEAAVGAPVLERTRGAIEPTDIGLLLLRHAKMLDTSLRDLDREIALTKGLELGELRIGVGPFGGSALVGPVVGRLSRMHPRLRVKLVVAPWRELPERARHRDVDLILAALNDVAALDDFESRALSVHPCPFVCRSGHPLAALPAPTAEDAFAYPLAGPALPEQVARSILDAMPAHTRPALQRRAPLTIECDSSTILTKILLESDALSMMPRFMVEPELAAGRLVMLPAIDVGVRVCFGAAWLRQRSMSRAGTRFIELLADYDAELAKLGARDRKSARESRPAAASRAAKRGGRGSRR